MKKHLAILMICIILLAATLVACDDTPDIPKVDYGADNCFEVSVEDGEDALVYAPKDIAPTQGLLFYVGTFLPPKSYDYLGEALAKQGYLAVFPKVSLAFYQYKEEEAAFARFKDVKFFIGGHSQGGGAAIRRAQENPERTAGLILLAPLCFKMGGATFEGSGDDHYNLTGTNIPSLVLHAESDRVLSAKQISAVFKCVDDEFCESHTISPGAHMSFSTADDDFTLGLFNHDGDGISEQGKQAQREATVKFVLAFLKSAAA